jgi:hypothetical protein
LVFTLSILASVLAYEIEHFALEAFCPRISQGKARAARRLRMAKFLLPSRPRNFCLNRILPNPAKAGKELPGWAIFAGPLGKMCRERKTAGHCPAVLQPVCPPFV